VRAPGRAIATFAVGFLVLDAVLLVWAGVELGRPALVAGGMACVAGALAVGLLWRRYRRVLREVDAGRREMHSQAELLRQFLKEHHLSN
jgi:uncharacterized membrane protein YccC